MARAKNLLAMKQTRTATRAAPAAHRYWQLAVFVVGLLVNLPAFSQYHIGIHDEAVVSLGAERLLNGEFPYRDWDSRFPTGSYVLTAFLFAVMGVGMTAVRVGMLLTTAVVGLLVFEIGCRLMPRPWALLAWAMLLSGALSQVPILSYHWIAIVFFLCGILALAHWVEKPRPQALAAYGVSFSCACWTLQSEAAALLLTGTLVLVVKRKSLDRRSVGWLLAAFLSSSLLLWSYVLVTSTPQEVWRDNIASSVGLTVEFNRSPYNLSHLTDRWSGFWVSWKNSTFSFPVAVWAAHAVSYLLVWTIDYGLFFPVLMLASIAAWKERRRVPAFAVVVGGLLVFTVVCRHRQDMLYMKYLTPLWYVCLAYGVRRWMPRPRLWVSALLGIYATSFLFSLSDARNYRFPITTPRGTLYAAHPEQAQALNILYRRVYALTPPGTPSAAFPYASGFLFLSGIKNVVRSPVLPPLLYTRQQIEQARQAIEATRPEYLYHFPLDQEGILKDYPGLVPDDLRAEYAWSLSTLLEGYHLQEKVSGGEIYRRGLIAPGADTAKPTEG